MRGCVCRASALWRTVVPVLWYLPVRVCTVLVSFLWSFPRYFLAQGGAFLPWSSVPVCAQSLTVLAVVGCLFSAGPRHAHVCPGPGRGRERRDQEEAESPDVVITSLRPRFVFNNKFPRVVLVPPVVVQQRVCRRCPKRVNRGLALGRLHLRSPRVRTYVVTELVSVVRTARGSCCFARHTDTLATDTDTLAHGHGALCLGTQFVHSCLFNVDEKTEKTEKAKQRGWGSPAARFQGSAFLRPRRTGAHPKLPVAQALVSCLDNMVRVR